MTLHEEIEEQGFAILRGVFSSAEAVAMIAEAPTLQGQAGTRTLLETPFGARIAEDLRLMDLVRQVLGPGAIAVRGILFDKTPETNWNLAWHQDTKIAVCERVEADGFVQWSEKEGIVHCRPPVEILEASVAVRIHLDDCPIENGALKVIPGSHRSGFLSAGDESRQEFCACEAGDVVLMKPLLLHGSDKSDVAGHRRVVHIEYCSASLPDGMAWAFSVQNLRSH